MNSFFVFGIVLLATANNVSCSADSIIFPIYPESFHQQLAADVTTESVANSANHPVFELYDLLCGQKHNEVFNSLEGYLQPTEIDQLKNFTQAIESGYKVVENNAEHNSQDFH